MKNQELASVIAIRDYASRVVDNLYVKISNEQVNAIQRKIAQVDKRLIELILDSDLFSSKAIVKDEASK